MSGWGSVFANDAGASRAQRRKDDQAFKRMIRRQKRAQARREREQPKKESQDG